MKEKSTSTVQSPLYRGLVRLAHQREDLRPHLLPLLHAHKEAGKWSMVREDYLPTRLRGTPPVVPLGTNLAIWTWEDGGKWYGIAFQGRANKPLWYKIFRNEAQRQHEIDSTIKGNLSSSAYKRQRKEEKLQQVVTVKIGDILVSSWGYDQTNVEFYQVIKIIGKTMVVIRDIAQKTVSSKMNIDNVVAVPNKFVGPPMRRRITPVGSGRLTVKVDNVIQAYSWDGRPMYQTASNYGH